MSPEIRSFVQAQAVVAFSKANKNSGFDLNDFIQVATIAAWRAKEHYKSTRGASFNTYLTGVIKNDLYKIVRASHYKKRGGGGAAEDAKRFGRNSLCESAQVINIDEYVATGGAISAPVENETEYNLLVEQVKRRLPEECWSVYKQMVDPDEQLLKIAVEKCKNKNQFKIDKQTLADYLHLSRSQLTSIEEQIRTIVSEIL